MESDYNKLHHIAFERLDAKLFRLLAFLAAMALVGVNKSLGGSWWALPIAFATVSVGAIVLPTRFPKNEWRRQALVTLCKLRAWPWSGRMLAAVLVLSVTVVFDYHWRDMSLGRSFNIYLLAIVVSGLLFGLSVSVVTWLLSIPVVLFCVIPPEYSFDIDDLKELADLYIYSYQSLVALVVPVLLWGSCETRPSPEDGDGPRG